MELMMKREDYEMRKEPNEVMITHFKKMIESSNERLEAAKVRYDELKAEVDRNKEKVKRNEDQDMSCENGIVESTVSNESRNDDVVVLESFDESDVFQSDDDEGNENAERIANEFNYQLNFEASSSSISRISSETSNDNTQE